MDKILDNFIGLEIDTYVITELIGTGCVGRVYKAENRDFSDERAIKFVPLDVIEKKKDGNKRL